MAEDKQQLAGLAAKTDSLAKGPKLHLDAARANTMDCHVTTDGQLVNSRPATRDVPVLQTYLGICSSPIPLPPSSSALTSLPTTPRYWETETSVRVVGDVVLVTVLEMGLCETGQVDSGLFVSRQRRSWCVREESCGRHGRSLCTKVYGDRKFGVCHQNSMSLNPGTQATLHYGVVLDVGREKVAFIDLDRQVILGNYNAKFNEPLVPIFSAGWPSSGHTVSMSLMSGEDIIMTYTKKALIYQVLK